MKKITCLLFCLVLGNGVAFAQTSPVTGFVISADDGRPVIGASVKVNGTATGAFTDADGAFSLSAPDGANMLVVSHPGMITQEVAIQSFVSVLMQRNTQPLDGVVATALGLSRDKKALGYAVQEINADVLMQAAATNLANALQGKTSGLSIRPSSGMPGASSQITIRGVRSFSGNNAPLYVVDGMPVATNADMSTGAGVSGIDFANRAIDIDPNDIESVNLLKGQAAAALYGIRASNGVIVITTKSGKRLAKNGKPQITFSSNVSFDVISRYPELQTTYAQGSRGRYAPMSSESWGPKITALPNDPEYGGNTDNPLTRQYGLKEGYYYVTQLARAGLEPWVEPQAYNNVKDYFKTGATWNNYVNVAQAMEHSTYTCSLGNSSQTGIVPTTGMDRYSARAAQETQLYPHWKLGFSGSYISTSIRKMPLANDGIVATLYGAPPSYDLAGIPPSYKDNPAQINNYRAGNFPPPYWAQDHMEFTEKSDRFYGNVFIDYATEWGDNHRLELKYQPGVDFYTSSYQDLWGYGIKGTNSNGQVENYNLSNRTINSLFTAGYDWNISERLDLDVLLGNEIVHNNYRYLYAYGSGYQFPGWNHINNTTVKDNTHQDTQDRTAGFFGSVSLAYHNMLYLNVTGRNDIVSAMPRGSRSFFYPSVSLGFILTESGVLKNNPVLNYAKLRAAFAKVGQTGDGDNVYRSTYYSVPFYGSGFYTFTPLMYPVSGANAYTPYYRIYDPNLTPQHTQSYEFGFDTRFFDNLFTLDYTFTRQNVNDQIFGVPLAGSTGTGYMVTNAGSLHTHSHEITLGVHPVETRHVNWNMAFNWTKVDNYVDELAPGVESIFLGGFTTPQVRAGKGEEYPVIYGTGYKRDAQGHLLVDANGMPVAGESQVIGRVSPDFTLGFHTALSVYEFTLSAVIDWKAGGQMYGGTNGLLGYYGVGKETEGREGAFVVDGYKEDGTKNDIPISGADQWQTYFETLNEIEEASIYPNSFVKLREIALAYPVLKRPSLHVDVSVFARNLLVRTKYPNFDPESSLGNTNMVGAFERFSLPQTSNYGLGLTVKF
jgi:TonB-linked SusC/RagA family outer membrane protein